MDSLTIIWVIVCAYLLLNLLVGVYCHIRVKDSTDYLLAGRRIGVLMTAGTLAATEIGGGSTVGVAAKAYGSWGLSAGWYVVSAGIGVILVAFIAPLLRRAMATTVPEIIGRRFGASSHLITSILSMLATITLAGVQITATATIISVLTGLSTELAILICGAVLVIYTMSGGMWSVTMTDVIHFFVLVGGFSLAVPFVLHNVGGWESVVAKLPPEQLGFTKVGWKTIIGLVIMYFMTFSTGQESVQRYFAAKNERTAVLGSIICGIIMALFAFVPAILGLVALAEFPRIEANNAVATVALNLMPPVMAGFVMAAVVSATLSSGAGDLLGATRYSRLCVLFLGIIAIIISLVSKAIIPMLVFAFTMRSAGPFAAFLLGLTWKNATAGAGIWSIVLGSIAGVYWEFVGNPYGIMSIIFGSIVSLIAFVAVVCIERAMGKPPAPPAIPDDVKEI
ncbi:MAG: sodium:solute symporter family protein [Veillonella sp.]|nr:sodium:solute symporter family protein [Veillonella sp.]